MGSAVVPTRFQRACLAAALNTPKPLTVNEYLASLPTDARVTLESLRRMVQSTAPEAVESIRYGMPAYMYRGQPLVHFAAWKKHCALYGLDAASHRDALAGYDVANGTIRFSPKSPLPEALVTALLTDRIAAIEGVWQTTP